jgi:GPH family glycoside/pentoside/hexuronide:cation symporter
MDITKKLSFGNKLGYAVGNIGESLVLNAYYIYFIFFLTNAVGLSASIAGTISSVSVFFNACTDIFAGYKSDTSKNPKGKRRPFMAKAIIPLAIATFLIYTDFASIPMNSKVTYFILINLAFWTFMSLVDMPYLALAGEISDDTNERTGIRSLATAINYAGFIIASSGTIMMVTFFSKDGKVADTSGWSTVGLIYAIGVTIAYYTAYFFTKGKERPNDNIRAGVQNEKLFLKLKAAITTKPFLYILISDFIIYGTAMMCTSAYIYYLTYNLGFSESQSATVMLVYSIMVIILSLLLGKISELIGKKLTFIACTGIYGVGFVIFKFTGSTSHTIYIAFFLLALVISAIFVLTFAMIYDVGDYYFYKTGKRNDGTIMSVFNFFLKFSTGIAMFCLGALLSSCGFDASLAVQSEETLAGIENAMFLIPGVAGLIGSVIFFTYPLTEKRLEEVKASSSSNLPE